MIKFSRNETDVIILVEHGIWYNSDAFQLKINQSRPYQAQLLLEQFQENLNRELSRVKEKYYKEGWKNAKAKTRKRTDFYGGWEK